MRLFFLRAPLILVLGHDNCGAVDATVKALKDKTEYPGHLPALVNAIKPAVELASNSGAKDLMAAAVQANVRLAVERLKAAQPLLQVMVQQKKLGVVGGVYSLVTGKVALV